MGPALREFRAPLRLQLLFSTLALLCGPPGAGLLAYLVTTQGLSDLWLPVLLLAIGLFGTGASVALSGRLFLEEEGLCRVRFGRETYIAFADARALRYERWLGRWVLRSPHDAIPIYDQLDGYLELLRALRDRVPLGVPEDLAHLPLRLRAAPLGWAALLLVPLLLLSTAALDLLRAGPRPVSYALVLLGLLWLVLFGLLVPITLEFHPRRVRVAYLLRVAVYPLSRLAQAALVTQHLHGAQSVALELRFTGRRRPLRLSQLLVPFPLPVLLEKLDEAVAQRRAEMEEAEAPYNGNDRRKNPRALS